MGACKSGDGIAQANGVQGLPREAQGSNPFYDIDSGDANEQAILSRYQFQSRYKDQFLGQCSVLQQKSSGDLYLCKQLQFTDQQQMKKQVDLIKNRHENLNFQNVIQIKQIVTKPSEGFFGQIHKVFIIIDYPFVNFHKEIASRITNKMCFTKEEIINFISSTVKGYAGIERVGLCNDKVRLKNIFIGIKGREPIIKVAENSLIDQKSNFKYMMQDGPNKETNRDIYLSPQQFLSWADENDAYVPANKKSGVYSLGMCVLDACLMEPSREMYLFTEKQIDQTQVKNRIQITGKKYGGNIEKVLRQMLEKDPSKRISFSQLQQQLPNLTKNQTQSGSKMNLSLIPSQRSSYINNDVSTLRNSQMFRSSVSNVNMSGSRVFTSRIKMDQSRVKEEEPLEVTQHYTNGNKYKGEKKGQMKHGKGRYELADGSYYEGEWSQNKINGKGILYFKTGKPQYDGQWRNDLFDGWGTLYSESGIWQKYEGQFRSGVKQGRGRMHFGNGLVYDGEFRGDKISGRGRRISSDGEVMEKYWDTISPQLFT